MSSTLLVSVFILYTVRFSRLVLKNNVLTNNLLCPIVQFQELKKENFLIFTLFSLIILELNYSKPHESKNGNVQVNVYF